MNFKNKSKTCLQVEETPDLMPAPKEGIPAFNDKTPLTTKVACPPVYGADAVHNLRHSRPKGTIVDEKQEETR